MLFSKRKGQAALEYLITYGWALAVIVVAIGTLSYFGLLNPNKYIPDSCEFGEQLKCVDQYIGGQDDGTNGEIVLRFRNNFEDDINITNVYTTTRSIDYSDKNKDLESIPPRHDVVIKKGEVGRVYINVNDEIYPNSKERVGIIVEFVRTTGTVKHNITGEVFSEVTENTLGLLS